MVSLSDKIGAWCILTNNRLCPSTHWNFTEQHWIAHQLRLELRRWLVLGVFSLLAATALPILLLLQGVVGHDDDGPPEEPLLHLRGKLLEVESSLVKVEAIGGALLKPPEGHCCSSMAAKPVGVVQSLHHLMVNVLSLHLLLLPLLHSSRSSLATISLLYLPH